MVSHAYALHIHHMMPVWQVIAVRLAPVYHNDTEGYRSALLMRFRRGVVASLYVCYLSTEESVQSGDTGETNKQRSFENLTPRPPSPRRRRGQAERSEATRRANRYVFSIIVRP